MMSKSTRIAGWLSGLAACALIANPAFALDKAEVSRVDAGNVQVTWEDSKGSKDRIDIFVVATPDAALDGLTPVASHQGSGKASVALPVAERRFVRLRDGGDGSITTVAERELPLEKGSNFRDLGGYVTKDGRHVRWGRIYRSGALPLISPQDYALLDGLNIGSIIDLRSLEEREVAATQLDDATGALFIANDYSLKPLMANFGKGNGEYVYDGMGKMMAPQYRSIFKRLLADDGAVMYHCSAGQDRTGIASALILSVLGVDRDTIIADYHLSTQLRRPQNEMPILNPADYPNNPIVQYYMAAAAKPGGAKAEPLYSKAGVSHLVQFFEIIDRDYGSVEGYLTQELGFAPADFERLRSLYLEPK